MANSWVQHGNTLTTTAPSGGVVSGKMYKVGALIVVADVTVDAGQEFEGHTIGVWEYAKVQADAPAQFAKAYLKADGSAVTTAASGNTLIGIFTEAYANGDTIAHVRLNGVGV